MPNADWLQSWGNFHIETSTGRPRNVKYSPRAANNPRGPHGAAEIYQLEARGLGGGDMDSTRRIETTLWVEVASPLLAPYNCTPWKCKGGKIHSGPQLVRNVPGD